MDYGRISELTLGLEHRHSDGSWGSLERSHHDPAELDPEREWATGEIYICKACGEQIRVRHLEDPGSAKG
jgi:hypothetical protein